MSNVYSINCTSNIKYQGEQSRFSDLCRSYLNLSSGYVEIEQVETANEKQYAFGKRRETQEGLGGFIKKVGKLVSYVFFPIPMLALAVSYFSGRKIEVVYDVDQLKAGDLLFHGKDKMKKDKFLVKRSVQENPKSFIYASDVLRGDEKFVKELIKENPEVFQYATEEVQCKILENISDDKDLNCDLLSYAKEGLRKDESFIGKLAVKNPIFFTYADESLRKNKSFIKKLVAENPRAIACADKSVLEDQNFITSLIKINPSVYPLVSDYIVVDDREAFIKENPKTLANCEDTFLIKKLVLENPKRFEEVDSFLRSDKEFVKELVLEKPEIFQYASYFLRIDKEFVAELSEERPEVAQYALEDQPLN